MTCAPKRVIIATKNAGKAGELGRMLATSSVDFVGLADVAPDAPEAPETGVTFEENAKQKATFYANLLGEPCIADDSGLAVDVLDGAPGVYSARWTGDHTVNSDELCTKLVDELLAAGVDHSPAEYVCALALAYPDDGWPVTVTGQLNGEVRVDAHGDGGFAYDQHFWLPSGHTLADLTVDEKNRLSHRGRAVHNMLDALARRWTVTVGNVTVYPVA